MITSNHARERGTTRFVLGLTESDKRALKRERGGSRLKWFVRLREEADAGCDEDVHLTKVRSVARQLEHLKQLLVGHKARTDAADNCDRCRNVCGHDWLARDFP